MWPISGCTNPCNNRPSTMAAPPIPVPTVRYTKLFTFWAAPHVASPTAAAFTSVSNLTFNPNARLIRPAKSVCAHPGLGVEVMKPYVDDEGSRSTGPKDPIPKEVKRCPRCWYSVKNAIARSIVSFGVVVGNKVSASRSFALDPITQTNFVPPASIPP